jgi:hypothetical protein
MDPYIVIYFVTDKNFILNNVSNPSLFLNDGENIIDLNEIYLNSYESFYNLSDFKFWGKPGS